MSYEYLERQAKQEQRLVAKLPGGAAASPRPLTTETFLTSDISHLGGVVGTNPELDTASGKGQLRPRGPDREHMAHKVAGSPTPQATGVETDHIETTHAQAVISARGRMGKGRASPERAFAGVEGRPAGHRSDRHTWEVRGVRSAEQAALIPSDHVVLREMGATWTPEKGGQSPSGEGESPKPAIVLNRQDVGRLSSMSPWQRPAAAVEDAAAASSPSWRQTGRPDVEPASPESRLSGSLRKNLSHVNVSNDSPFGAGTSPVAEPVAGSGMDDDYFAKQALRDELLSLSIRQLRERAANAGVERGAVEHAVDEAEDPKLAVISLIVGVSATNRMLQI